METKVRHLVVALVFDPTLERVLLVRKIAKGAMRKLSEAQGTRFGEVITCEQQSNITPLAGEFRVNTPDANLFIYS